MGLGLVFGVALFAHGLQMLLSQHPLGACSIKPTPNSGDVPASAICESWTHEEGTSWALRFKGDAVLWNNEAGKCNEFLAVRFAGERGSLSEADCRQRAKELATHHEEQDRCLLDKSRGLCYIQCLCSEEARRNTSVMAWLFLIAGATGVASAMACVGLDAFQKLDTSGESTDMEDQANISQDVSKPITEDEIDRELPAIYVSGCPQCVVCLSSVMESELARQLKCGHQFHANCILGWWMYRPQKSLECPVCKQIHQIPRAESKSTQDHDGHLGTQVIGAGA